MAEAEAMQAQAVARYAGHAAQEIAARCGVPRLALYDELSSTLDVAHELAAAGAPDGALVLAERQTAGRGRGGNEWMSEHGAGIWLTLVAHPADDAALEVLSLRVGLAAARALEPFATGALRIKWPNDLMLDDGKLGGILIESRWRESRLQWAAIGMGINCRAPSAIARARALNVDVDRVDVLAAVLPAVRDAATAEGGLTAGELDEFAARDWALGMRCTEPLAGIVHGIDARGGLVVRTGTGDVAARSGSLILEDAP